MLLLLLMMLAPAEPAGAIPVAGDVPAVTRLDVPFLPQTEALCGGAAAAMIFRYWGERRADVQQFEPLVDRRAGGIADDVLIDAIRQRHWEAVRLMGSIDVVRTRLAAGQPLMLLIEDRPRRYHYVVAVGADSDHVYLHDPAWGPARRFSIANLLRVWQPSNFWTLLVLPGAAAAPALREPAAPWSPDRSGSEPPLTEATPCDRLLADAVAEIGTRGLAVADEALGEVRRRCPVASGPIRELAGVRFAQGRWRDAAALAEEAVGLHANDRYAWDVLGSSRFIQNDLHGALAAWNHTGKPQLDSVRIEGLTRTRYNLVAEALALTPNTLVTADGYRFAERRLQQLPNSVRTRLGYRPDVDGFATVDVTILERSVWPHGLLEWTAEGTRTLATREVRATIPGNTGQGEVWTASWRWWSGRPRIAGSFTAPRVGRLAGVWRVEAFWEKQSYTAPNGSVLREERRQGGVSVTDWLSSNVRYELSADIERWNGVRRTASIGGTLERRLFDDRLAAAASVRTWMPLSSGGGFRSSSAHVTFRTSTEARGFVHLADAGIEGVTSGAPLSVWPGAGGGHARTPLARAHPELRDGVVQGPVFGRRLEYVNLETRRWFERPSIVRLGVAAFADAARASRRLTPAGGEPFQVDTGVGLRLRIPGQEGTLRVDYGRGLRDGRDALTIGWQF